MTNRKRVSLALVLFFVISGLSTLMVSFLIPVNHNHDHSTNSLSQAGVFPSLFIPSKSKKASFNNIDPTLLRSSEPKFSTNASNATFLSTNDDISRHITKTLNYIYANIHPDTRLSYSLPGDKRLTHWSVVYDNAMRSMAHLITGDVANARRTIDYFIDNTAIHKMGWIEKEGRLLTQHGWVINIVDAAETRDGGRGIEHIAHTGPNAFLGIAAVHLFQATQDKKYLHFARERWRLIKGLQNENPKDANYGGVRMGPMGNPSNFLEQRLDFKPDNPSFYQIYNGEHAADFRAFSELMAVVDEKYEEDYRRACDLISHWDKKIYNPQKHLFAIGTSEVRFFEPNIGEWVGPGVIHIYPLDTQALKINTYGLEGLERFEENAAQKIRDAIEANFRVNVETEVNGSKQIVSGYDFVTHQDRKRLIMFREEGPARDKKVKKGVGREPLVSDEWSSWVAMSDLRLAKGYIQRQDRELAAKHWKLYRTNIFSEGVKTAVRVSEDRLAYPYAHPLPYALNVPVGFGWNTHHAPYSIIGGVSRIMGMTGFDPFSLDSPQYAYKREPGRIHYANRFDLKPRQSLVTEAEEYINRAWEYVVLANRRGPNEEELWQMAARTIEDMNRSHPDWSVIAAQQNQQAHASNEPFPLLGLSPLYAKDLEPIYRRYWALYHLGTGEFIRVMAYSRLAQIAKRKGLREEQLAAEHRVREASMKIVKNYYYSQAFDDSNAWMWQPINSLKEYVSPPILQSIKGYQLAVEKFQEYQQ